MDLIIEPGNKLRGEIYLPGDKSISHRVIMCASLASGISTIKGLLESTDCLATIQAFRDMGIEIDRQGELTTVEGKGLYGLKKPNKELDFGNSGTSMRLISGILACQNFNSILTGDVSLLNRPMERIANPLKRMGLSIETQNDGTPPLHISKVNKIYSINYEMPVASAQVKSSILFAALYANGTSTIREKSQTRDHTERIFEKFGIPIEISESNENKLITVRPPKEIQPCEVEV